MDEVQQETIRVSYSEPTARTSDSIGMTTVMAAGTDDAPLPIAGACAAIEVSTEAHDGRGI